MILGWSAIANFLFCKKVTGYRVAYCFQSIRRMKKMEVDRIAKPFCTTKPNRPTLKEYMFSNGFRLVSKGILDGTLPQNRSSHSKKNKSCNNWRDIYSSA